MESSECHDVSSCLGVPVQVSNETNPVSTSRHVSRQTVPDLLIIGGCHSDGCAGVCPEGHCWTPS